MSALVHAECFVFCALLVCHAAASYTVGMTTFIEKSKRAAQALAVRLRGWIARPFESLYRWGIPLFLLTALCFALPAIVGFILLLPFAAVLAAKALHALRAIHELTLISLAEHKGRVELDTTRDRLQRAWVLGCIALVGLSLLTLAVKATFALVPTLHLTNEIGTYLTFMTVLVSGFLLFYYCALRFDSALMRGLASVTVTLPAFFVIVALVSLLLKWIMRMVAALGLSAESMIADGFSWVYDIQRILGSGTDYFLQQDPLIIGASIVFAALLLLLYAYTVPYYWMKSVSLWLRGLGLVAVVFSGAVIVFAGVWVVDVQRWAATSEGSQLAQAIDAGILSRQADTLSGYRSDDLIALVKAFVLPYTVGVFVANVVVALRKAAAKRDSDAILNTFAEDASIDDAALPALQKRYLFFGGNRTLWDIALRSIKADVNLPSPFAPRKLTLKERLTGELEEGQ